MRRSNCTRALQYVPELTWLLFLRILDEHEAREVDEAEALGIRFKSSIPKNRIAGAIGPRLIRRCVRTNAIVWKFVHEDLLPKLKGLTTDRLTPLHMRRGSIHQFAEQYRHVHRRCHAAESRAAGTQAVSPNYGALLRRLPHRTAGVDAKGIVEIRHVEQWTKSTVLSW